MIKDDEGCLHSTILEGNKLVTCTFGGKSTGIGDRLDLKFNILTELSN